MSDLTNAERETHFNQNADDRSVWEVATNDPVWVARMEKAGATLIRKRGETHFFTMPDSQFTVRKALSPEQRAAQVERGRLASENFRKQAVQP